MTRANQNYMGIGWTGAELAEARQEAALANPQWERNAYDGTLSSHNNRCGPCGVGWRAIGDFSTCWNCGEIPAHDNNAWPTPLRAPVVNAEYQYATQPRTPDSGCGCDDPTVEHVAKLLGEGWDLWNACLHVYREVAA